MKRLSRMALFLSIVIATQLNALIIESSDIRNLLHHVYDTHHHKEILVIFDIDNTIGHITDGFGGDEWFSAMLAKHLENNGTNDTAAVDAAVAEILPLYFMIQNTLWLDPVQDGIADLIRFLQDVGIATMALTSRSHAIKARTLEQLLHLDVDFTRNSIYDKHIDLSMHVRAYFDNGVIFSGQNDKGALLIKFFETIDYWPQKVIFIDDKMKYVESVGRAVEAHDIAYVGIRYSALDDFVASYNLDDYQQRLIDFSAKHIHATA